METFRVNINGQDFDVNYDFIGGMYLSEKFISKLHLDLPPITINGLSIKDYVNGEDEEYEQIAENMIDEDGHTSYDRNDAESRTGFTTWRGEFVEWDPTQETFNEYIMNSTPIDPDRPDILSDTYIYNALVYAYDRWNRRNKHKYVLYYFNSNDFLQGMLTVFQWYRYGVNPRFYIKYVVRHADDQLMTF